MTKPTGYIPVGYIGRPIGLDGWLKLTIYGGAILDLELPLRLLSIPKKISNSPQALPELPASAESIEITKLENQGKEKFRCRLQGVDDRTASDKAAGRELYIAAAELPAAGDEEIYLYQLLCLDVFCNDARVGKVSQVYDFGPHPNLEIEVDGGKKVQVPYLQDFVDSSRIDENRLDINRLDDFLSI